MPKRKKEASKKQKKEENYLFILPDFIISTHLCAWLKVSELVNFGTVCKKLYNAVDKSHVWTKIAMERFRPTGKAENWRLFYLSELQRYMDMLQTPNSHLAKVYHSKLLENVDTTTQLNICLIGNVYVGKTSMVYRLIDKKFDPGAQYNPWDKEFTTEIDIENTSVRLRILDPPPQEEYIVLLASDIEVSQVCILLYDICGDFNFQADVLTFWLDVVTSTKQAQDVNIILVGTKMDQRTPGHISTEQGASLAKRFGAAFFETSARDNINIKEVFEEAVWIYARRLYTKKLQFNSTEIAYKTSKKCSVM